MQTLRLATAFLSQLSSPADALPIALTLERCCLSHGITFLSLGSTGLNGAAFLEQKNCISTLAAALTHTSFTIKWLPNWCLKEAKILAEEIFRMAEMTHGSANFRFGVSFNCPPGIPYFPAAEAPESGEESPCILDNGDASEGAATAKGTSSFALGLENSGLLYQAFKNAQIELQNAKKRGVELDPLAAAHAMLLSEATSALQPLETIAKEIEIAKDQLRQEGKAEAMLDNIAKGKLNRFFKDNTLVNQDYIKDSSMSVSAYIKSVDAGLTVTGFKRVALG